MSGRLCAAVARRVRLASEMACHESTLVVLLSKLPESCQRLPARQCHFRSLSLCPPKLLSSYFDLL